MKDLNNNNNNIIIYDSLAINSLKDSKCVNSKNLELIKGNVLDKKKFKKNITGSDIVIHLAAIAGIDTVIKSPTNTMNVNMLGTANILEAVMSLKNCERFVALSTSEVFGVQAFKPEETDYTIMGTVGEARWTYAVSKLAGEHLIHAYHKEFGLPTVTIRPFNVYGPGQVGEGAIRTFVTRALKNEDIEIHGDGTQIRAWCLRQLGLPGREVQLELPFLTMKLNRQNYKIFGIVTNMDWEGENLIHWHHERCGKSEEAYAVMKEDLAGGKLPSGKFGENAAWLWIMILSLNLNAVMRRLVLGKSWVSKRMKAIRFSFINLPERVLERSRELIVRLVKGHSSLGILLEARRRIMELVPEPYG